MKNLRRKNKAPKDCLFNTADLNDLDLFFKIIKKKRKNQNLSLREQNYMNHVRKDPKNLLSIRDSLDGTIQKQNMMNSWISELKVEHEVGRTRDSLLK
mmetsp:Transcript_15733/g.13756  ORF Transcript_15733/g.13756 Transcript_15733/m.13756 type:complete len:98 (+) Transcript_15733:71-364(+)